MSQEHCVEIKLLFNLVVWAPCKGNCLPSQICNSSSPGTITTQKTPERIITGCYPSKVSKCIHREMSSRLLCLAAPVRAAAQRGQRARSKPRLSMQNDQMNAALGAMESRNQFEKGKCSTEGHSLEWSQAWFDSWTR